MRAAIATVVIGDSYRRHYERIFLPSVRRYADAHGYDLLLFDRSLCPPGWQHLSTAGFTKLLMALQPEARDLDRLLVLDADILVNRNAPPFAEVELNGGVGIVDEWSQPSVAERVAYQRANGWETTPAEYYARSGIAWETEVLLNSGMFICSPAEHGAFFADVVERYLAGGLHHPRGVHYEQAATGFELHRAGLARLLPAAWNRIWSPHRPRDGNAAADKLQLFKHFAELYSRSYCLHVTMGRDHDFAYFVRNR